MLVALLAYLWTHPLTPEDAAEVAAWTANPANGGEVSPFEPSAEASPFARPVRYPRLGMQEPDWAFVER